MKKVVETGIVGNDGRLRLPLDRVHQFTAHLKGRRIIATFEVVPIEQTEAQRAYYENYVLPTIRDAIWEKGTRLSEEQLDMFLVGEYPDHGDHDHAREFDKRTMYEFIEWLQEYAVENFDTYIEDPSLINPDKSEKEAI